MKYRNLIVIAVCVCSVTNGGFGAENTFVGVTCLEHCLVSLIEDVEIPAQEAGIMTVLSVREGDTVQKGALLGRIDDASSILQKQLAIAERQVSEVRADNDVNIRYADATRHVASLEYQLNSEANVRVPGTKSAVELQKLLLTVEQAKLQIEQATLEQHVAKLTVETNAVRVAMALEDIRRREIRAAIDGEVVDVLLHTEEWVNPGTPVLRIVRLDKLRVEGYALADTISQVDIRSKRVTVSASLARGREEAFEGRIVFVDPRIQAGGEYRVWAEIENRQERGHWLLQPGHDARMTVHIEATDDHEKAE